MIEVNEVPQLSSEDRKRLSGSQGIVTFTDEGDSEVMQNVRRVAAKVAGQLGTTLYLADRSMRTWGETPHTRGPAGLDYMKEMEFAYMVEQMEEALEIGAPDVKWLAPSVPNLDSVRDAVTATGANIVIIPANIDHLGWWERVQSRGNLTGQVKEMMTEISGEHHVITVDNKGFIKLV